MGTQDATLRVVLFAGGVAIGMGVIPVAYFLACRRLVKGHR